MMSELYGPFSLSTRVYSQFQCSRYTINGLIAENVHFNWSTRCEQAFHDLKSALIHAMPLLPFNPDADIHIHTDASKFAVAAVLLQRDPTDSSKFRPIEYRLQNSGIININGIFISRSFMLSNGHLPSFGITLKVDLF